MGYRGVVQRYQEECWEVELAGRMRAHNTPSHSLYVTHQPRPLTFTAAQTVIHCKETRLLFKHMLKCLN